MTNNDLGDVVKRLQVMENDIQALRGRTFGTFAYYLLVIAATLVILDIGYDAIKDFIQGFSDAMG